MNIDLFGGELSALTDVTDLQGDADASLAAMEAFWGSVEMGGTPSNNDPGNQQQPQQPCPCYMSRDIRSDGSSLIRIILTGQFVIHTPKYVAVLDAATERDAVHITIDAETAIGVQATPYRALLSACCRCKAHLTTYAGSLCSMPRVALWLTGDRVTISKIGWIRLEQLCSGAIGNTADIENALNEAKTTWSEFRDYIVSRGLFTAEEMDGMYTHRSILTLFGKDLQTKVEQINQASISN